MTTTTEPLRLLLEDGEPDKARRKYPHIFKALDEMTWAVTAPMLATIQTIHDRLLAGERLSPVELDFALVEARHRDDIFEVRTIEYETRARGGGARTTGQIAVLPLYGVMMPRAGVFSQMSGGCSVESFTNAFKSAMNDPDVSSILIDIDSPGGATDLVPELCDAIFGARGEKPIAAVANTDAGSGALWVASQCDELGVTKSGRVGSIGCYATHQDLSAALEKAGVKTTLISYGKYKTELHPTSPLSEEATAAVQDIVNHYGEMFVAGVARGRGVSTATAGGESFGQGRMLTAGQAVKVGMADRVATFDDMVNRLARGAVQAGKPSGAPRAARTEHVEIVGQPSPEASKLDLAIADILADADASTLVVDGNETVVVKLDQHLTPEHVAHLGDRLSAAVGGRKVLILDKKATLELARADGDEPPVDEPDEDTQDSPAAEATGDVPQDRPSGRHLHRPAVRAALRTAAEAAREGGTTT